MKSMLMAAALLGALAGCTTTNPNVVDRNDAQRMSSLIDAVVLSTRPVVVDGSQSGFGAAAGGLIGGIAGSTVGGSTEGAIVSILGAVAGGVLGNAMERSATREDAVEVMLQLRNGERRAVVQALTAETLSPGDAVIIITTGDKVRVVKSPPAQPALPTSASAPSRS